MSRTLAILFLLLTVTLPGYADNGESAIIKRRKDGETEYRPITDANNKVLPGERMDLIVEKKNGHAVAIKSITWDIPGHKFDDFRISVNSGVLVSFDERRLRLNPIRKWYWVSAENDILIKATVVTDDDETEELSAQMHFVNPVVDYSTLFWGDVIWSDILGIGLMKSATEEPGIEFEASVKVPEPNLAGDWHFFQMVKGQDYYIDAGGKWLLEYSNQWVGDTHYPYFPEPWGQPHPGGDPGKWAADGTKHTTQDTPHYLPPDGATQVGTERNDYRMYVMFLPKGPNSRFVPLRRIDWWWKGDAKPTDHLWDLIPGTTGKSEKPVAVVDFVHPEWERLHSSAEGKKGAITLVAAPNDVVETTQTPIKLTLTASPAPANDLVIVLTSTHGEYLRPPSPLTIRAGETSISVDVQVTPTVTNELVAVQLSATPDNKQYSPGTDTVVIRDKEP